MSPKQPPLGEIAESLPTAYGENMGEAELDLPVVKVRNVSADGRLRLPLDHRSFSKKNLDRYLLDQGELLVVKSSGSKANVLSGKTAHVEYAQAGKTIASNFLMRLKPDETRVESRYLWYYLNSRYSKAFVYRVVGATTYPNLKWSTYKNHPIPLPPLTEQKRIAAILEKADALRAKRRHAIAKLDELLQSVFLDMFGDPVTNPKGWPTERVSEICRLVRGSSPRPKSDPRFYGGPVPRLMVADLTRDGWFTTPRIDSLTVEGSQRSRPAKAGTVVMAVSGNVGLVSRLNIDACIHDGFVGFPDLADDIILPNILMLILHFTKERHFRITAGAIFKNLTTTDIKAIDVPLPPVETQHKIDAAFKNVLRMRDVHQLCLTRMDHLFASLQQRAFKGQL